MKLTICFLFAAFAMIANGDQQQKELAIVKPLNTFNLDLIKLLNKQDSSKNAFYSPTSIAIAFGMLNAGANGKTRDELLRTFKLEGLNNVDDAFAKLMDGLRSDNRPPTNNSFELNLANRILVDESQKVTDEYMNKVRGLYEASVDNVNFATDNVKITDDVNAWVKQQTKGKIDSVFGEPLPSTTKMVLANAIYFKGTWMKQFKTRSTKKNTFYGNANQEVDFMFQKDRIQSTKYGGNSRLVSLPYDGSASMMILLPDEGVTLDQVITNLNSDEFEKAISNFEFVQRPETELYLPKFKMETTYDLKPIMSSLGASSMFSDNDADFSGITGRIELKVDKAIHKAVVEVNEEGTVAAAVTAISMTRMMAVMEPPRPLIIRVNRPFLFVIRDNVTGVNLFTGKVTQL